MNRKSTDYFTPEKIAEQRREVEGQGLVRDEFLAKDADCPVFGINLACAYPFPATLEKAYNTMAAKLAALDKSVYVYPLWETHVTIMTFVNFGLYKNPTREKLYELRSLLSPISEVIRNVFDRKAVKAFALEFRPPVLTRKAAILPISNPSGEIAKIRRRAMQLLEGNRGLLNRVTQTGLNVPGIIHSTIMRFPKPPKDPARFAAEFAAATAEMPSFSVPIREVYLTVETKPYMRQGEITHRFQLAEATTRG